MCFRRNAVDAACLQLLSRKATKTFYLNIVGLTMESIGRIQVARCYVIIFDALMQIAVTLWIGQHFSAQRTCGRSGLEQYCKKDAIQFITAWYMVGLLFVVRSATHLRARFILRRLVNQLTCKKYSRLWSFCGAIRFSKLLIVSRCVFVAIKK